MSASAAVRWGVIGHDDVVTSLATAVAAGRVSHSYLITGPQGVGRTALALGLARALNCEAEPANRPCNSCDACRRISRGSHPDVLLVDMAWQEEMIEKPRRGTAQSRRSLSIDTVRFLRQDIATRPMHGRWKLHIVDDASRFSNEAPDAFLKTLEEPPPYAVIVLIASSLDDVSETIRSRCRHIAMGTVSSDIIRATLAARGVDEAQATQLARAARGRIAWALNMANDARMLAARREQIELAFEQVTTPLGRVSISGVIARDASRKRDALLESLSYWTGLWRDALLLRAGLADDVVYPEVADRLAHFARDHDISDLYRALWATQRCVSDLNANVQARIALHAMVMQWPG
jgi:DNA polymerase III subunit delta'